MRAMRTIRLLAVALVAILVLAACGDDEVSLDPPEVKYGEDVSEMGMFVVDPRYTVATLPEGASDWLLFDDIGELFKYRDTHAGAEFQAIWVHDYHTEEWLKAEDAWYVESAGLNSPMGWGIAAFEQEDAASAFQAEHGGDMMSWDEADARLWTAPPPPEALGATPAAVDHSQHGANLAPAQGASPAATPPASPVAAPGSETPAHEGH